MSKGNAKTLREFRASMKKEPDKSTSGLIAVCYPGLVSTAHVCLTFLPRAPRHFPELARASYRRDTAIWNLVQLLRMLYALNEYQAPIPSGIDDLSLLVNSHEHCSYKTIDNALFRSLSQPRSNILSRWLEEEEDEQEAADDERQWCCKDNSAFFIRTSIYSPVPVSSRRKRPR